MEFASLEHSAVLALGGALEGARITPGAPIGVGWVWWGSVRQPTRLCGTGSTPVGTPEPLVTICHGGGTFLVQVEHSIKTTLNRLFPTAC